MRAGLAELGYVEGQTVSLEARFAHHRLERLPTLAAELVAGQPDVIHTWTSGAARALAAATSTIPIVVGPSPRRACQSSSATWSARPATSRA